MTTSPGWGTPGWGLLPGYNEHQVGDFGGMNLAMAVVLGVAATLDRRLATTALVAYLVFALPHLVFHLNHLEPFVTVDAVAQVVMLAVAAGLPVPLLVLAAGRTLLPPDQAAAAQPQRSHPQCHFRVMSRTDPDWTIEADPARRGEETRWPRR
jgi:hypothetical protein